MSNVKNSIAKINGIQIVTYVMGIAASAASVIAIQGDIRKISSISKHFVHFGSMWNVTERHSEIEKRYDIVETLLKEFIYKSDLQDLLYEVYDLERLSGRISYGNANGRDLISLKNSLQN